MDEWTELFLTTPAPDLYMVGNQTKAFPEIAKLDLKDTNTLALLPQWKIDKIGKISLPPYSLKWDLASDPKFEEGVLYMASLNLKQPACFTMLGIVCLTKRDFNLAAAAFKRAIALSSTQKEILETKISEIEGYIIDSRKHAKETKTMVVKGVGILILVLSVIFYLVRRSLSRRAKKI
ncbi:MAG: hypothetical protein ABI042_13830 [Verrucomicrobiota bacterium]